MGTNINDKLINSFIQKKKEKEKKESVNHLPMIHELSRQVKE